MKASKKLKQKHIEDFLQDIEDFKFGEKKKINLQQHMTPPNLAAQLLFHIYQHQPIESYVVADIGVGTGMLMCGAIYLDAQFVLGIEIDEDYIQNTREMLEQKVQGADYDLINADARSFSLNTDLKPIDLVVMNPPFGTKQAGIDTQFLKLAMKICKGNIYSMHKSSTRKYIEKFAEENGYIFHLIFQVKFPLKKRFKGYHKKQIGFTEVDVIMLSPIKQKLNEKTIQSKQDNKSCEKIQEVN